MSDFPYLKRRIEDVRVCVCVCRDLHFERHESSEVSRQSSMR